MADSEDDVVLRLKVKDKAAFIADLKAGRLAVDDFSKATVVADSKSRIAASDVGGLGLLAKAGRIAGLAMLGTTIAATGLAAAVAVVGVKAGSSSEQAEIGFTTMLKSSGKAHAMMKSLNDFAIVTPFQLDSLRTTASMMLGMGFSAKEIIPDLTAVGDAMSGLGRTQDDVNGVAIALGKMRAHGKVDARDMLELTTRGVNSWQILADEMGTTVPKIQKMSEKGILAAKPAIDALIDGMENGTKHTVRFKGLMEKQAHSLAGIWSNTSDAIKVAAGNMMLPLFPAMERGLSKANDFIPREGRTLKALVPSTVKYLGQGKSEAASVGIDAMLGGTGRLTIPVMHAINVVQNLGKVWRTAVWPAVKLVLAAFLPLIAVIEHADGITKFLADHSDALRRILVTAVVVFGTYKAILITTNVAIKAYNTWTAISEIRTKSFTAATGAQRVGMVLYKGVMMAVSAATKIWAGVQWALNAAMDANPIGLIVIGVALLVTGLILAYKHSAKFRAIVQALGHAGKVAVGWVVDRFVDLWHWIKKIYEGAGPMFAGMWGGLKDGFKSVINWIIKAWNGLHFTMPSFDTHVPGVGKVGGFDVGMPQIPLLAQGGTATSAGTALVGENGPELLSMPRGASVIPLPRMNEIRSMARPIEVPVFLNGREIARAMHQAEDDMAALL